MHRAIIAIVHLPSKADVPTHGRYDSGYRWAVEKHPHIMAAEQALPRWQAERPLPADWAYEAHHWMG